MDSGFRLTSWIADAGVVHIEVDGDLDSDTADRLVNAIGVYREPISRCVVDLTDCYFIDSAGLRALLLCRLRLQQPQDLVLVGLRPSVERAIDLAHMWSVFDTEPLERSAAHIN